MLEAKCKDCAHYRKAEQTISANFITPAVHPEDNAPPLDVCDDGGVVECTHESCFELSAERTPVEGVMIIRTRIAGTGQLNANNDCEYFSPSLLSRINNFFKKFVE